jgi:hypothetical protein
MNFFIIKCTLFCKNRLQRYNNLPENLYSQSIDLFIFDLNEGTKELTLQLLVIQQKSSLLEAAFCI